MELQLITETRYYACKRFSDNSEKEKLCLKIASLKSWLHKNYGLNLNQVIRNKIKDLESDIPENLKKKFIKGAELLQSIGKIGKEEKNNFIENKVMVRKLVYINGEWQPINKLNTNYYDLAELLTDLIYKGGNKSEEIVQKTIKNPKQTLTELQPFIKRLIDKYFEDPKVFNDYTKNTINTTKIGEDAEDEVKKVLEKMGFKEEYIGGNGDFIDMVFGIDLIVSSSEYGFKTIQIKKNIGSWNPEDKYPYVDWIVTSDPFTIYDNKTKEKIKI